MQFCDFLASNGYQVNIESDFLGAGTFGKVFQGLDEAHSRMVCIKIIDK